MAANKDNSTTLPVGAQLFGPSFHYTLKRVLGQGGFGITYLANVIIPDGRGGWEETATPVTVKEFFMDGFNGREGTDVVHSGSGGAMEYYRKKFYKEAQSLQRLSHPGIVRIIEYFEQNGTVYYVMEYIPDGSLEAYISRHGAMAEPDALDMMLKICDAIHFMHSSGMLHLDIKPGNIMLRGTNPIIIDFGLARQYDFQGNPLTISQNAGGASPGYSPIEQNESTKGFPMTMDVYSLGATLYKMLTGERPPDAYTIFAKGLPSAPLERVTPQVRDIILRAMSPRYTDRYPTVKEMMGSLSKALTNLRPYAGDDAPVLIADLDDVAPVAAVDDSADQVVLLIDDDIDNASPAPMGQAAPKPAAPTPPPLNVAPPPLPNGGVTPPPLPPLPPIPPMPPRR